jgi:peptidyl-prolyl cis-trans isomerase D
MQDVTDSYGLTAAEVIFTTEKDQYTAPVETDFGWRVFYITKLSSETGDAESLKTATIDRLKAEKALDIFYDKSELINDELAAGASLSDIATTLSLEVKVALNVDISGYNSKGDLVTSIPNDPTFLTSAFDTLEGDEPQLEELDNNDYFLLVVDNIQLRALRPFEEVRTSVVDIWQADTRKNMAREQANEILTKAQDGSSMKELSLASTDMSYTTVTLARNDQTDKVAQTIHSNIFDLDIGRAKITTAADGNGFVVVKVTARKLSDGSMPPAMAAQLKNLLTQEYQQRFLSNYWRHLEASLPVKVNQRAVNAVHDQLASREQ